MVSAVGIVRVNQLRFRAMSGNSDFVVSWAINESLIITGWIFSISWEGALLKFKNSSKNVETWQRPLNTNFREIFVLSCDFGDDVAYFLHID